MSNFTKKQERRGNMPTPVRPLERAKNAIYPGRMYYKFKNRNEDEPQTPPEN